MRLSCPNTTMVLKDGIAILRLPFLAMAGLLGLLSLAGCAGKTFRFADADPLWRIEDQTPIPLPEETRYVRMDYYFKVLIRRPAVSVLHYPPAVRSRDVNSLDQVPASSWYTPRLGYREISPQELLRGPSKTGPPQMPVRVVRAKHQGSNPGFVIADSRDRLYLIKFDPPEFPAIETTTALIVNRLFWGFGYNVPEDYLFYINSGDLVVDPTADITEEQIKLVFGSTAPPENGVYRCTASLLIEGIYLGPIPDTGTRKDDPNDRFAHENRRVLRALKVFNAFTNQTDIRIDNSLDVYVGKAGKGYVKHYLLDFGGAFGGHGAAHGRPWEGYRHIFSFNQMFINLYTLGLRYEDWEKIDYTPWKSVGAFESQYFRPQDWKEMYPFEPIQRARPDDNYWAAKIIAALSREHFTTLVEAADYPEPGAAAYVVETLLERRRKIIDYYFGQVSPLEYLRLSDGWLYLEDYGKKFIKNLAENSRYEVRFFNEGKKKVAPPVWVESEGALIKILLPAGVMSRSKGYLRVEVRVWRGDTAASRAAQFHIRSSKDGLNRVVGVVH